MLKKLKFREKINLSFGGLVVLVAINALVGIYTAYVIADQIRVQENVARIVDEIVRIRDATDQFIKSRSRQAAQQTFLTLGQVRQMLTRGEAGSDALTPLLPLLDDYQLNFQKYVVEADQKAALESRALLLGRSMMEALKDARTRRAAAYDREMFDTMVGQILNLQWQGQELRSRARQPSPEQLMDIRNALAALRNPAQRRPQDIDAQRLLYRILQDANDYLTSFENYLRYQALNDKSEKALADISARLQAAAWAASEKERETIRRGIPTSIALMLGIFLVTLIGSGFAARRLSRAILKPILELRGTTQAITQGQLNERAVVTVEDEIGDLAHSFNQMTDGLRALQEDLERRVVERTQQLAEKNDSLRASEEKLRSLFELAPLGIALTDMEGRYIQFNEAFRAICGYPAEELIALDYWTLTPGKYRPEEARQLESLQRTGRYGPYEKEYRRKDGSLVPINLNGQLVTGEDGRSYIWSIVEDITERKLHQRQLEHVAHHDALTDLPNRVLLADRLHQAMVQTQRHDSLLAVIYLDLDGFKAINDTHGHHVGDRLLSLLADRMKQALREGDTLARLGGDEFVAVLLDLQDRKASVPVLDRLLAATAEPVHTHDLSLQVSASVGVTYFPQAEAVDADQLLRQADQAMYQAKQTGRNRYHIFDTEHDRSVRQHHEGLERIRQAVAEQEFVLHYQPKVNMRSGEVIGVEALIRWQHPERGLLPPGLFLPLIENHALSIEVGDWVLETALNQIEAWRGEGLTLPVSVNIDALQFGQTDFFDKLRKQLTAHPGVQAGDLELEVLETSALADIAQLSDLMQACHAIGVGFALDDFGTGYSSLTYLKRLPANLLKIDQSFVRDMLDDPDDLAILDGVLGLAVAFQRQAIAEGVETLAHGAMLLRMGCDLGQGYVIARPMPADAVAGWVQSWQPAREWLNLPRISRDDLPILFAMVEHRAWVATLGQYVRDELSAPPQIGAHACRFGQWLDKQGMLRYASLPAMQNVASLHVAVHHAAEELRLLKQQQRTDEIQAGFGEVETLGNALQEALLQLIDGLGN
ncbi:MAG: EAL domain-containing protein [Rhodocyclaceae bacterium]|nr:EAL domain-containing protein [Rhodocyclaceae bacterium]MDZ4215610.1 EAL domain-containing protein [Rhodocyclaceae bacterium]